MAAKKCYAVRKGRETGIFYDWDACKAVVEGYPGAEYKGFVRIGDAEAYLGSEGKTYGKDESSGAGGHFSGNRSAEADPGKRAQNTYRAQTVERRSREMPWVQAGGLGMG